MMSATPLVTVVIPVFNGLPHLEATLNCVQSQTQSNLQIVVIDDGSTDGTRSLVEGVAASDSRVECYSQRNAGLAAARNAGIARANAPFVAFLDADDLWHESKLDRQLAEINRPCGEGYPAMVYALTRYIDNEGRVLSDSPRWTVAGHVFARMLVTNFVSSGGSNMLCRTEAARDVGGFSTAYQPADAGLSEDLDFQLKLAIRYPVAVVPEYLVGYRQHPGGMSNNLERMSLSYAAVIHHHLAEASHLSPKFRKLVAASALVKELNIGMKRRDVVQLARVSLELLRQDPLRVVEEVGFRLKRRRLQSSPLRKHFNECDPRNAVAMVNMRVPTRALSVAEIEDQNLPSRC